MKKLISLTLSALLLLGMTICVSAAEPVWKRSGAEIGFKNFSDGIFYTDEMYSHGVEENSDYYCENMTDEATGLVYKHITAAGVATRPQKQINLVVPIGPADEIFMVNGTVVNDGDEFFLEVTSGYCFKAVVRTNYAMTSKITYDSGFAEAQSPLTANDQWEELYIVFPDGMGAKTFDQMAFFIFGGANKEDYPDGAYADIAAFAAFKSLDEAVATNIAPELISETSAPVAVATETDATEAPATETVETKAPETTAPATETGATEVVATADKAPQTFDAGVIAAVAAIVSAAGFTVAKKRK